ncbi:TPA: hypothetical protein G8V61_004045 [Salmonella enterica]|nr:hypothetical protein [Salmonella enterica subsp. enterica serovar Minnesota]HAG2521294.1 hypothetical protein [Salmonella enterica]
MKNQKVKIILLMLALSMASGSAFAEWFTRVQDDAFSDGHTAMMISSQNSMRGITFDCSSETLSVSYIEQTGSRQITEDSPVNMLFRIDGGTPIKFNAHTTIRNSKYLGIIADDADGLKTLLAQLRKAKSQVLLGLQSPGDDDKMSFTFNATGSTTAVNKFIKACNIDLPALDAKKK